MNIIKLLKKKVIILDGAIGTQLQAQGMPAGVCPEQWCLENPRRLEKIHADYRQAGADIIYTGTFGANRFKLGQYNISEVIHVNKQLVAIARRAAGRALVAGSIGPTGRFVVPFGSLDFEEAVEAFKEQVKGLLAGGIDLFAIETMMDIQEARAALIAVKELSNKFTIVTMTYDDAGRTLNGTDPVTALVTLQSLGADAVGCNCSTGPHHMVEFIRAMKPYAVVPLAAKPNAGSAVLVDNQTCFEMSPSAFASFGKELAGAGVNLLGGCCGAGPYHIRELKKEVAESPPAAPKRLAVAAVSSARRAVILDQDKPLFIIGEKINPTGKKTLSEELQAGKFSLVRKLAKEQESDGAQLLDINAGVPGIDETKTLVGVINFLAPLTCLPLAIDSPDSAALAAALRVYPGRALINSISAEEEKTARLLPLAAKYGAMFIFLPLSGKEIPQTADERKEIITRFFKKAKAAGFSKEDIIIDGLALAVCANAGAAVETLKTIEWCTQEFKCRTVVGLSNISFGLPRREEINAAFLAMAQARGLTLAIANPGSEALAQTQRAADVLTQKDKGAAGFIAYQNKLSRTDKTAAPNISIEEKVFAAVREGNKEDIEELVSQAVNSGIDPDKFIDTVLIKAITAVGDLFDKKEYFLPQLIASAETMQKAVAVIKPHLKQDNSGRERKTTILIATVKGDIHDIGKNIVALMLRTHGFSVIDLGKDVSAEKIIEEIKKYNPEIVGLSALMTTTMVNAKEVIAQAAKEKLTCKFLIGGAVVTKLYADSIGAAYAKDGVEAVRVAKKIVALE